MFVGYVRVSSESDRQNSDLQRDGLISVGVFRLWRDGGYALGALLAGFIADQVGVRSAIAAVGALTVLSGVLVLVTMRETLSRRQTALTSPNISTAPEVT